MQIVGELINASRKAIKAAIEAQDEAAKVSFLISPFVPNSNAILFQVTNIRVALQKPQ